VICENPKTDGNVARNRQMEKSGCSIACTNIV
jgi:hypothetical protein